MSEPDLEAINARYESAENQPGHPAGALLDAWVRSARDVPTLLEAIDRLRSMVMDAQTEAEMQASRVGQLLVCAEWARRTIDDEWPDGPTGDTENWRRFVAVIDRGEGPPPELWEG